MNRRLIASSVLLVSFAAAASAQVPFDREQYRIKHAKFVLKNDLTLIVHEDKSVPLVAVNMCQWFD